MTWEPHLFEFVSRRCYFIDHIDWSWRIDSSWLTDDAASALRLYIAYMASGNRYFPFSHGPLNLSTPGGHSFKLEFRLLLPSRWFPWCIWHACVEMWTKVHGRVQSSVEFRNCLLHSHSLSFSTPWSPNSFSPNLGLQTIFLSSFSNRSSPRSYYANSPRIWFAVNYPLLLLLEFVGSYSTPHIFDSSISSKANICSI